MESAGPRSTEPRPAEDLSSAPQVTHPLCPYCHADVRPGQLQPFGCSACMAWSHHACWEEHGSCPACGDNAGPRPGRRARTRPRQLQSRARDGTAEPAAQAQPWWVGRTNHCTRCSSEFVVTNRYQRYTCPACVRTSTFWAALLFVIIAVVYVALVVGPDLLR